LTAFVAAGLTVTGAGGLTATGDPALTITEIGGPPPYTADLVRYRSRYRSDIGPKT